MLDVETVRATCLYTMEAWRCLHAIGDLEAVECGNRPCAPGCTDDLCHGKTGEVFCLHEQGTVRGSIAVRCAAIRLRPDGYQLRNYVVVDRERTD